MIEHMHLMQEHEFSAHELYRVSLQQVLQSGERVVTRGMVTKEILHYTTVINAPRHHVHIVPGRRWNPWLALSEALWILAGRDDIAPLLPYNKNIASFSDDGIRNYGAYGARIGDQIQQVFDRLERDPNDRRCVISIWNPADLTATTKDPPCNDMLLFKQREGKLNMTVVNRSNDLHWGLYGVNIPTFGILLDYMAAYLGVSMGHQIHYSDSLHVYTGGNGMKKNYDITKNMMARFFEPQLDIPEHENAFIDHVELPKLRRACNAVLDNTDVQPHYEGDIKFLRFADEFLTAYRIGPDALAKLAFLASGQNYRDWLLAGTTWFNEGKQEAAKW